MRSALPFACAALVSLASAAGRAKDAAPFQRGVCYAHAWRGGGDEGYGSATSQKTLERLKRLGVEWISLTPFGFMESPRAVEIRVASARGPGESDERMRREVAHAHALGLKVALKPHLWIRDGQWQGALVFANEAAWRAWWKSYRAFILRYAALAERDGYDMLVIGTELKSATACDPECWRALIAELRAVYHGPLTYAANWDEAERVPFWSALDYIGVDAYAPIANKPGAAEPALCLAWKTLADSLAALSRRTGKRVILTELGYRATRDAAMAPATWPERDPNPAFDGGEQASVLPRRVLDAVGPVVAGGHLRVEVVHRQPRRGWADRLLACRQAGRVGDRRLLSAPVPLIAAAVGAARGAAVAAPRPARSVAIEAGAGERLRRARGRATVAAGPDEQGDAGEQHEEAAPLRRRQPEIARVGLGHIGRAQKIEHEPHRRIRDRQDRTRRCRAAACAGGAARRTRARCRPPTAPRRARDRGAARRGSARRGRTRCGGRDDRAR